jgi:hypothetical protein
MMMVASAGLTACFPAANVSEGGGAVGDGSAVQSAGPAAPASGPSATPSPSPTPSPSQTQSQSQSPAPGRRLSLPRVPWEGGPSYYGNFLNGSQMANANYFPIGVWYESVLSQSDIDMDKAVGINTYVQLDEGSKPELIRNAGMFAISSPERMVGEGTEHVAWELPDEVDMWADAGSAVWTGNWPGDGAVCSPDNTGCGYTVLQKFIGELPADNKMKYANFGKGVAFWTSDSDGAGFVNNFTQIVSSDIYWYTDPNVCYSSSEGPSIGVTESNCRRAANYGLTMDIMRKLDGMDNKRKPIWAFIENGSPFTESDSRTINGDQLQGAVMNSIIHEARGVIYFNHSFGGSCRSQHNFRESCGDAIRPQATAINAQIKSLAPVLNTQSYAWVFNSKLDTMLKEYNGSYYIFAMLGRTGSPGSQTFALPGGLNGSKVEVPFENRSIGITDGKFTDTFAAEYTYHIYKITP